LCAASHDSLFPRGIDICTDKYLTDNAVARNRTRRYAIIVPRAAMVVSAKGTWPSSVAGSVFVIIERSSG
jgi:hypothetical protein